MTAEALKKELAEKGNPVIADSSRRFFKTGPGEYGEGDHFRGIRVPELRKLARKYRNISLQEAEELLHSPYHEDRLLALFLLIEHFSKADEAGKEKIYHLYLQNTRYINNWDLVDASAGAIVGRYLRDKKRDKIYELAGSADLWERRIAIMATFDFIKQDEFDDALKIIEERLHDDHDLIHKASGWMLREIGNRDLETEEAFLEKYAWQMPRVMLRYAIEKFPEEKRQYYLRKTESG